MVILIHTGLQCFFSPVQSASQYRRCKYAGCNPPVTRPIFLLGNDAVCATVVIPTNPCSAAAQPPKLFQTQALRDERDYLLMRDTSPSRPPLRSSLSARDAGHCPPCGRPESPLVLKRHRHPEVSTTKGHRQEHCTRNRSSTIVSEGFLRTWKMQQHQAPKAGCQPAHRKVETVPKLLWRYEENTSQQQQ